MGYKTINGLMRHLRDNEIQISGSIQKRQLMNTGYFHGYKGYRFFKCAQNLLPFTTYKEVYATIQYDSALKALFYGKIMFIETDVKHIVLESILVNANSENIQDMFDKLISGYNNSPSSFTIDQRKKLQQNKLNLQKSIHANLAYAYKRDNPKITHFYNNSSYTDVPVWGLFEIMTMGDLGHVLSCLTYEVRDDISKRLGLNISCDTYRQLIYQYIYTLKDLRNSIAHNAVLFDTRFRSIDPTNSMKRCLQLEIGLPYINFKAIDDYVILMCYFLKLLKVSKAEIKAFIRNFEKITNDYKNSVNIKVTAIVIRPDLKERMNLLENFL